MSLKLNMQEIKRLNNAAVRAMEQTVDALQTEIRTAQVMPYDNGDMQNLSLIHICPRVMLTRKN